MMFKRLEESLKSLQFKPPESGEFAFSAVSEYTDDALKALDEWHAAENYFNSINDPDLVEYALYEMEAARRKYEYLMRKLRSGDAAWEHGSAYQE
jgi:hypothetical protein